MHYDIKDHNDEYRMNAVIAFCRNALEYGRGYSREKAVPLFCDGINVDTKEPLTWRFPNYKEVIISNLANQQNLFRTLTALTAITGNNEYKTAAEEAIRYHFDNLVDSSGLLRWGGHMFIDLKTLEPVGPAEKEYVHELKNCLPFYDLMYEVNPEATIKFIKAFWNAHVYNWEDMDVGRHGRYGLRVGSEWEYEPIQLPPHRESIGLSFINTGNDLIYAAATLSCLNGDTNALKWARHLAYQYVLARDPQTGLGAYQFTQARKTEEPQDDNQTLSKFGDRAKRQFGPEFGEVALESKMLRAGGAEAIYGKNALVQLIIAGQNRENAKDFLDWTHQGLLSFSRYAYNPQTNSFKPMFTDGTDLTGYVLKRNGYYGSAGEAIQEYFAHPGFLLSYAKAFLHIRDIKLWSMSRSIARGNGLGDLGEEPGKGVQINTEARCSDPVALFSVISLYQATGCSDYLTLGRIIGNNILERSYHHGFFIKDAQRVYTKWDALEPFALVTLQAAIEGKLDDIPVFVNGAGFISGGYLFPDGTFETVFDEELYSMKRGQPIASLIKGTGLPDGN